MNISYAGNVAAGSGAQRTAGGLAWRPVRDQVEVSEMPPSERVAHDLGVHFIAVTESGVELPALKVCASGCVGGHAPNAQDGQSRRSLGHVDPSLIGRAPDRASGAGALCGQTTATNCTKVGVR